jgi:hypothetical protein
MRKEAEVTTFLRGRTAGNCEATCFGFALRLVATTTHRGIRWQPWPETYDATLVVLLDFIPRNDRQRFITRVGDKS